MNDERRVYGLDVLRATAILLVVLSHVLGIDPVLRPLPVVVSIGRLGVEFFFVLSGFLIGGIIIRLLHTNRFNTWRDLCHFWLNRWFRTLPIYYIFFLFYCAAHGHFFSQIHQRASYLLFLQNIAWPIPVDFFGQSWSLSVEEWFYLLFPLLLFVLFAVLRLPMRGSVLATACFFLATSLLLKAIHGQEHTFDGFEHSIRKFVIFRFDALMYGVLMAYLRYERLDIWNWMAARSTLAFAFLGAVCLFAIFGNRYLFIAPWLQLFLFPCISLAVATTIPFFAEWKQTDSALRRPVVGLAKSSYSIYLSHPIPLTAIDKFPALENNYLVSYPLTVICIFALGALSYGFIEAPLMALRQKWNDRFMARRRTEAAAAIPA